MNRVEVFNIHPERRVAKAAVGRYVSRVLRSSRVDKALVRVILVGSGYIRRVNKRYLRHDYVTDVISFQLESGRFLEGEIYVNLDRAKSQSKKYHVTYGSEVARLVVHGTLHLVGYDDSTPRKRLAMKKVEDGHIDYWFAKD